MGGLYGIYGIYAPFFTHLTILLLKVVFGNEVFGQQRFDEHLLGAGVQAQILIFPFQTFGQGSEDVPQLLHVVVQGLDPFPDVLPVGEESFF